jgi:hypothetical protein
MRTTRDDAPRVCAPRSPPAPIPRARVSPPLAATAIITGGVAVTTGVLGSAALYVPLIVIAGLVALASVHEVFGSIGAGLTLLLARPYNPGERVRLYVPELGQEVNAEIVRLGLVSTTLATDTGLLALPNSRLLRVAPECRR